MESTERPRFVVAMNAMAATFQRPMTEAGLTGYWMGLSDLPLAAVEKAVQAAMRTRKFMPVVADLRELAGHGEIALEDRASICWLVFTKAMRQHGYYHSVDFDDAGVNFAVRCIGAWDEDFELTNYTEKRFRDAYCAFYRTGAGDGTALLGYHDRHNGAKGYGAKEPVAIACGLPPLRPRIAHEQTKRLPAPNALLEGIGNVPQ